VRKRRWVVTERGPQARVKPVKLPGVDWIRDPVVASAPDGWFYLTGTTSRMGLRAPGARMWRSRDLRHWEPRGDKHGVVWYADQWDWCAQPRMCNWDANLGPTHRLWGGWLFHCRGTFWLTFSMSFGGSGLLRSTSGQAEGPYEPVAQVEKFGLGGGFFFDDDGAVYHTAGCTEIARMKDDLTGLAEKPRRIGPASGMRYGYEGGRLMKILGKYVLFGVDWNGTDIWLEGRKGEGTYDAVYCVADRLDGPYSEPRLAIPHVGALIQGPDRGWWASTFGNANGDITAAAPCELGFIRMRVERAGEDLIIEPMEE
jgi:beta-xylosidase